MFDLKVCLYPEMDVRLSGGMCLNPHPIFFETKSKKMFVLSGFEIGTIFFEFDPVLN